jgi:hypothetical protein
VRRAPIDSPRRMSLFSWGTPPSPNPLVSLRSGLRNLCLVPPRMIATNNLAHSYEPSFLGGNTSPLPPGSLRSGLRITRVASPTLLGAVRREVGDMLIWLVYEGSERSETKGVWGVTPQEHSIRFSYAL